MKGEELINVAQAATHGDVRYVRNVKNRKEGVVVALDEDTIKVRVNNAIEVWCVEECEDSSPQFRA